MGLHGLLVFFWLALIFLVIDLIGVRQGWNVGGHFAHWGGLLAGFVAMKIWSKSDSDVVQYNHRRPKTDEQFNTERLHREEKLNAILDKIGRSGFDSLTQSEKNFLEEQSKK